MEREAERLGQPIGASVVGTGYWRLDLVWNFASCPGYRVARACHTPSIELRPAPVPLRRVRRPEIPSAARQGTSI